MANRIPIRAALTAAALLLASTRDAGAQAIGGPIGQQASPMPLMTNPILNPYLSPYGAQFAGHNTDFLLYMYATNQANGGIGSGVISGTRPAPGMAAGTKLPGQNPAMLQRGPGQQSASGNRKVNKRLAETMPMSATNPGAAAGDYFNRGPQARNGAGKYYNRAYTRFNNNGIN